MSTPSIEKIIEHHLNQNAGQKLSPHLIIGLVSVISQNIKSVHLPAAEEIPPTPLEVPK